MITKLTEEQKSLLPVWMEKWKRICFSTEPANRPEAEAGIARAYEIAGFSMPRIVWCGSPLGNALTRAAALNYGSSVGDSVGASIESDIWSIARSSVRYSIAARVWNGIRESGMPSVTDNVKEAVRDGVEANVKDGGWDGVRDSIYGQHDATWLSLYDYLTECCGLIDETKKLEGLWQVAKNAGWFLPHKKMCWISERHHMCKLLDGKLHAEGGPAVSYPDGFSVWALHGVRVPQHIAETPAERLDVNLILTEQNAEIRREIVRKIGIERVLGQLKARSLDKWNGYELLLLPIPGMNIQPTYLMMKNPSTGTWHIEGIPPGCKTCKDALIWRNLGIEAKPTILT